LAGKGGVGEEEKRQEGISGKNQGNERGVFVGRCLRKKRAGGKGGEADDVANGDQIKEREGREELRGGETF